MNVTVIADTQLIMLSHTHINETRAYRSRGYDDGT